MTAQHLAPHHRFISTLICLPPSATCSCGFVHLCTATYIASQTSPIFATQPVHGRVDLRWFAFVRYGLSRCFFSLRFLAWFDRFVVTHAFDSTSSLRAFECGRHPGHDGRERICLTTLMAAYLPTKRRCHTLDVKGLPSVRWYASITGHHHRPRLPNCFAI